jgi:hypothetical protein
VLGSPLSASHVLAAGSRITRLSMVNHKKIIRRNLTLALTNKPADDQMHKTTETNALSNNPTNFSIKTVLILRTQRVYISSYYTGLDERFGFTDNFLQGWVRRIPNIFGGDSRI